jgi:hypothetical protein
MLPLKTGAISLFPERSLLCQESGVHKSAKLNLTYYFLYFSPLLLTFLMADSTSDSNPVCLFFS